MSKEKRILKIHSVLRKLQGLEELVNRIKNQTLRSKNRKIQCCFDVILHHDHKL